MKKSLVRISLIVAIVSAISMSAAKKTSDPIVVKVGNEEVPYSEFEYLYKKNNAQLQSGMSLDDYIEMFVNYKLKVQAAHDAGLDTSVTYRRDMEQYGERLAGPYMQDKEMLDSLITEAYSHHKKVFSVDQLLIPGGMTEVERKHQRAYADSIHAVLLAGEDFAEVIERYLSDPTVKQKGFGGPMVFTAGSVPYRFEDEAYLTPIGEYSPVFSTSYGLHILKVKSREDNPGEVKVRHILKLTRDKSPEEAAMQKNAIDSIYTLLKNGANFQEIASVETEDPSGKNMGGDLPWFGKGRMVPEFETTAYALADGEISQPIQTSYGWHIILKEGSKPVESLDNMRQDLTDLLERDYRKGLIIRRAIDKYAKRNKLKTNTKLLEKAKTLVASEGLGQEVRGKLADMKGSLMTLGNKTLTMADIIKYIPQTVGDDAVRALTEAYNQGRQQFVSQDMLATLPDREPNYRNLRNEYSDGLLMFEVSNQEVWNRANKDLEGLEAFYQQHKTDYTWDKPHYLGYVVSATNDSIATEAVKFLNTLNVEDNQLGTELRKKFGNNAKVERVNAAMGEYPIIDYIAFDGQLPTTDKRWKAFRQYRGKIKDQPSAAMEVKGRVSVDYQKQLEADWMKSLRERYPVSVDREYLKKMLE